MKPLQSTASRASFEPDAAGNRCILVQYRLPAEGTETIVIAGGDRSLSTWLGAFIAWAEATGGNFAVKELEYWDNDLQAGAAARAVLAYLETCQGRERAGPAPGFPDRAASADGGRIDS